MPVRFYYDIASGAGRAFCGILVAKPVASFEKELNMLEGIPWIGIGCIICVLAWTFRLGSFHEPAPGFVAFLSGLFVCSIGIVMVLLEIFSKGRVKNRPHPLPLFQKVPWRRLTYTVGFLLGYILFFEALGYIVVTFLLMVGLSFDWEKKRWVSSFLFSIGTVLVSYLIFEVWLHCQLPRGVFPWW